MKKYLFKDKEFERNKEEILKMAGLSKSDLSKLNFGNNFNIVKNHRDNNKKYAWQYELDEYKKRKNKERFYAFGAICGILSLFLNIVINYSKIKDVFLLILQSIKF